MMWGNVHDVILKGVKQGAKLCHDGLNSCRLCAHTPKPIELIFPGDDIMP